MKISFRILVSLLFISFSFGIYISKQHYQPQIVRLTRQLNRTQKQLKKVNEEIADMTSKIADLTGNGG